MSETESILNESWARGWSGVGAAGSGFSIRDALLAAYREPSRSYHSEQHLAECLALFQEYRTLAHHPAEIEIALWFHDAVYDVRAHDNEEKSAAWAESELARAGGGGDAITRVRELILATRHSSAPTDRDQALLVDIDLAILGAPTRRFDEYETQVRNEYAWVADEDFRVGRATILKRFLARSSIYTTPELRGRFEESARVNLWRSLIQLGA